MYFQYEKNNFYIDSMDLVYFEKSNKTSWIYCILGKKNISFYNKYLKIQIWIRIFLCCYNLNMLCESLKQKIGVFILPIYLVKKMSGYDCNLGSLKRERTLRQKCLGNALRDKLKLSLA